MTIFRLVFNVRTTFPWFGSCAVRDYARDDLSFASFSIMVGEVHSFKWISLYLVEEFPDHLRLTLALDTVTLIQELRNGHQFHPRVQKTNPR